MSKFKLRNLKNERRKLDKMIAKLELEEYKRINSRVIAKGKISLCEIVNFNSSIIEEFLVETINHKIDCDITFKHIFNKITCIIKVNDSNFRDCDVFIGEAVCDSNVDFFSIPYGMTISQTRAIIKIREHYLKLLCK